MVKVATSTTLKLDHFKSPDMAMPEDLSFKGEILVVDNDASMRETLRTTLGRKGYAVVSFADSASLMFHAKASTPLCVVLEIGASGPLGIDILKKLTIEKCPAPVLVTSTMGTIPMAVNAIKSGAFDFIVKPICGEEIVRRVEQAINEYEPANSEDASLSFYAPEAEPLNRRERQVLAGVSVGDTNKEIALRLRLSPRTIEGYRASIMMKIGVKNRTELMRRIFCGPKHLTRRRGPASR